MDAIAAASARLERAADLPAIIGAACDAFEDMLPAPHEQQDPAGGAFTTFVMSAVVAARGRNALLHAPSLPSAVSGRAAEAAIGRVTALDAATALAAPCAVFPAGPVYGMFRYRAEGKRPCGLVLGGVLAEPTLPLAHRCGQFTGVPVHVRVPGHRHLLQPRPGCDRGHSGDLLPDSPVHDLRDRLSVFERPGAVCGRDCSCRAATGQLRILRAAFAGARLPVTGRYVAAALAGRSAAIITCLRATGWRPISAGAF